jgi:prevent-host-death family protein
MNRIPTVSQTMTITNAKARLSELVAMVKRTQEHVDITRNGEPGAVLVSHAEIEALRETIAILSDATSVEDIRQSEADVATGNTVSAETLHESTQARRPTRV